MTSPSTPIPPPQKKENPSCAFWLPHFSFRNPATPNVSPCWLRSELGAGVGRQSKVQPLGAENGLLFVEPHRCARHCNRHFLHYLWGMPHRPHFSDVETDCVTSGRRRAETCLRINSDSVASTLPCWRRGSVRQSFNMFPELLHCSSRHCSRH